MSMTSMLKYSFMLFLTLVILGAGGFAILHTNDWQTPLVVTQQAIEEALLQKQEGLLVEHFTKDQPVCLYIYKKDPSRIPQVILEEAGKVDSTTHYSEEVLRQRFAFVLQMGEEGVFDFYPIEKKDYNNYEEVDRQEVIEKNPLLVAAINEVPKLKALWEANGKQLIYARKTKVVTMVKLSALGLASTQAKQRIEIQTPSLGKDQLVDGVDAYVVLRQPYYIIQIDSQTQYPIGYVPATTHTPR